MIKTKISHGIYLCIGVMSLVAAFLNEADDLEVTRHSVGQNIHSRPGVRIAQITDLHLVGQAAVEKKVLQVINQEDPDLIVLTGDILTFADRQPALEEFLRQLPTRARKWAVMGNWEYKTGIDTQVLASLYAKHHVTLLINAAVMVDQRFLLVGLDDFNRGDPDWHKAMAWHKEWQGATLILAHNPVTVNHLPRMGRKTADTLLLAGHTHGGQIALFGFSLKPIGLQDSSCMSGWCKDKPVASMYVARGIGTSVIPLRIGAKPELALFEWFLP